MKPRNSAGNLFYIQILGRFTDPTRIADSRETPFGRPRIVESGCAAAGGDVPGQGFHWAPAVTAAIAGTLSAPVQENKKRGSAASMTLVQGPANCVGRGGSLRWGLETGEIDHLLSRCLSHA